MCDTGTTNQPINESTIHQSTILNGYFCHFIETLDFVSYSLSMSVLSSKSHSHCTSSELTVCVFLVSYLNTTEIFEQAIGSKSDSEAHAKPQHIGRFHRVPFSDSGIRQGLGNGSSQTICLFWIQKHDSSSGANNISNKN